MKKLIICILLTGCSHGGKAWMQGVSRDSIVVAYQGFDDSAESKKAREAVAAEHCAGFEWQKVESKSQPYMNAFTGVNKTYVDAGTNEWWEATYSCTPRKPASP